MDLNHKMVFGVVCGMVTGLCALFVRGSDCGERAFPWYFIRTLAEGDILFENGYAV